MSSDKGELVCILLMVNFFLNQRFNRMTNLNLVFFNWVMMNFCICRRIRKLLLRVRDV